METKQCTVCGEVKSLSEFGLVKGVYRSDCKVCKNISSREYYLNNKEKKAEWSKKYRKVKKDQDLKKMYGISLKEYEVKEVEQGHSCAICFIHKKDIPRALCVDHDHKTGKIRGLLCDTCNRALGLLKDSKIVLSSALTYLEKHK